MKYLPRFVLLTVVILAVSAWANGQTAISPEKRAVITELIAVTKTEEQILKSTDAMIAVMDESYPAILRSSLEKMTELPAKEREEMINSLVGRHQVFSKKMRERIPQRINYKQFIEETYYPLYDKFFTESELRELVNFYKTPAGQKFIDTMPQLFAEATRLSLEKLSPQITKLIDEIIKEETASVSPPAPAKKTN